MIKKRVLKVKTFARWAKNVLTDAQLCLAAKEILLGQYEADLGSGLCKKRIAKAGQGKSSSTRTLVAKEGKNCIFFIAGREKSDPGTDFSTANIDAAKLIGSALQRANQAKIDELITEGTLKEICNDNFG
jgi:hypothetical protein